MHIAICYYGQLRHTRLVMNTHFKYLLKYLIDCGHTYDIYFYTDNINTSRCGHSYNNTLKWIKTPVDKSIIEECFNKLSKYSINKQLKIVEYSNIDENDYIGCISDIYYKYIGVLKMIDINIDYDYIISLRPDGLLENNIIFPNILNLEFLFDETDEVD